MSSIPDIDYSIEIQLPSDFRHRKCIQDAGHYSGVAYPRIFDLTGSGRHFVETGQRNIPGIGIRTCGRPATQADYAPHRRPCLARHLLATIGLGDMRAFYEATGMLATSEVADIALIRSHIAYWQGVAVAENASIRASRGHSYRIALNGRHGANDYFVRITDHYDHRKGVTGFVSACDPTASQVERTADAILESGVLA